MLLSIVDLTGIAESQHDGGVRSLSFSPLVTCLLVTVRTTHGLMSHKTPGNEMKSSIESVERVDVLR